MLYRLFKIPARLAFWIYCRRLVVNNPGLLKHDGPLLIACNHPNSFFDAIIISTIFKKPVYSLARGDVFKNRYLSAILRSLNMFPVYRTSEGVENLEHNYTSFNSCKEIFRKNGIVLIFSEGSCFNEWHLRPLKKGTARLAISSWMDGIDLEVLPTGINYNSFTSFGKNIQLNFGGIIRMDQVELERGFGRAVGSFNEVLKNKLGPLVLEIDKNDQSALHKQFYSPVPTLKKILLFLPAVLGYILHWPIFYPIHQYVWKKASQNDHYDSLMIGILFGVYPLYLVLLAALIGIFTCSFYWLLIFIVLPFCARSYVQLKKQF